MRQTEDEEVVTCDERTTRTIVDGIEAIKNDADMRINDYVEAHVRPLVIAACRRLNARYVTGNGEWMFLPRRGKQSMIMAHHIEESKRYAWLLPIRKLLDTPIGHNDVIGFRLEEVTWYDVWQAQDGTYYAEMTPRDGDADVMVLTRNETTQEAGRRACEDHVRQRGRFAPENTSGAAEPRHTEQEENA